MSRIDVILEKQKKKALKQKKNNFKKYEEDDKALDKLTPLEPLAPVVPQQNRTVVSIEADEDEEIFDESAVLEEEDVDESSEEGNVNDKAIVAPKVETVFAYDDSNSEDIDDKEESLMDIFVNRMFKQDPVLVHKAVAHTMTTDFRSVALFLFNWYADQDQTGFANYQSAKDKVVSVLRMRYGKFNDEFEFTHAVAHWFVNGVLGIRK